MSLQNRIELQESVKQFIDSFMKDNNISAADMQDALNKVSVQLQEQIMSDFIRELYANAAAAPVQEESVKDE